MSAQTEQDRVIARRLDSYDMALITRREAIQRVTALLGGMALVGGNALLTGCRDDRRVAETATAGIQFTAEEIAFLDEVAETILPETSTPGAKAAGVGAFMAHMVNATYEERDQQLFRDGIQRLDEASQQMHNVGFMQATPQQRLALLQQLDREQMAHMQARAEARRRAAAPPAPAPPGEPTDTAEAADTTEADAHLPDQRQAGAIGAETTGAEAITADAPAHYFRMMKELALLGYFTSEVGYTQAMRYQETPGRYDPCVPYTPGEPAWAPHA